MVLKGKLASSLYFKQRWKNWVNEWELKVNKMGWWTWFWLFLLLETSVWALKKTHTLTWFWLFLLLKPVSRQFNHCCVQVGCDFSEDFDNSVILCETWGVVVESNTVTDHFCNTICPSCSLQPISQVVQCCVGHRLWMWTWVVFHLSLWMFGLCTLCFKRLCMPLLMHEHSNDFLLCPS